MATQHSRKNTMKFIEGFIEHKGQDSKWKPHWCVLRDKVLYIFNNKETLQENHTGTLELNSETRFIVGDSDPKKESFRFDLRTSRHLNKFKTKRYSERELWRGYITGISTGSVPQDLDLMQGQLRMIQDDIDIFHENKQVPSLPRRPSIGGGSLPSGFSNPDGSIDGIFPIISEMSFVDNGGPFNKHKFWMDRNRTEIPSWYFSHCTRELAEKIVTIASDFGNTLMRDCFTFCDTGSYTITKATGRNFAHFEVMRVQDGYKINAVNSPQTFRCLSDVMKHFVQMSGAATTRLITTNNFKMLGLDPPPYTTKIVQFDGENGEVTQNESYEIPTMTSPYLDGSKTLPIKNKFTSFQKLPPNDGTRATQARPGIDCIQESSDAAVALNTLDGAIDYDDEHPYRHRIPAAGLGFKRFESPPLPPLLPADPCHKIVRKTSRSQSVPAIQLLKNNSILNQNVPISRDPGVVKRQQVCRDSDNPYNRNISNSKIDDPYKSRFSDPYRRDMDNENFPDPYRRDMDKENIPDPYRRQDMDKEHFPDPNRLDMDNDNFPEPYTADMDNESFPDPYTGDMDNESFPDPYTGDIHDPGLYKQGSKPERTFNSYRRGSLPPLPSTRPSQIYQNLQTTAESFQPPVCSPKSLSGQRHISGGDESQLLGDIMSKLNQLKSTGKSVTDSQVASKSDVSARAVPPPVAAKSKPIGSAEQMTSTQNTRLSSSITTYRDKDDNSSSGSIKDINGNSKSGIEKCATTADKKDDIKKKLEAMFAKQPPPAIGLHKAKSSPSLPISPQSSPSIPNFPPPTLPDLDDQIYEEIPETDE